MARVRRIAGIVLCILGLLVLSEVALRAIGWAWLAGSGRGADGSANHAGLVLLCVGDSNVYGLREVAKAPIRRSFKR